MRAKGVDRHCYLSSHLRVQQQLHIKYIELIVIQQLLVYPSLSPRPVILNKENTVSFQQYKNNIKHITIVQLMLFWLTYKTKNFSSKLKGSPRSTLAKSLKVNQISTTTNIKLTYQISKIKILRGNISAVKIFSNMSSMPPLLQVMPMFL